MTNYSSSLNQTSHHRQPSSQNQTNFQPSQKVYLYGDTQYRGILIRPLERTYPTRWTVEVDRGGYDSPTIEEITPLTPYSIQSDTEIPFSDEPEQDYPKPNISQLEQEIIALRKENALLKQENQQLREELNEAKKTIRRAKDISLVIRQSLKRVLRLAHQACMDVQRTVRGWILKMGEKARKFRRLADIWDILSQDEWYLSDIFAPEKLIPLDKIQPPRPRTRPTPAEKLTLPILCPEEVLRRRAMGLPKCC
jgi:hypothetical protein